MGTLLEFIAVHTGNPVCCYDPSVGVSLSRSQFGGPAKKEFTYKIWLFGIAVTMKYVECKSHIFLAGWLMRPNGFRKEKKKNV